MIDTHPLQPRDTHATHRRYGNGSLIVIAAVAPIIVCLLPVHASNDASGSRASGSGPSTPDLLALKSAVVAHYSVLVHATYKDALEGVQNLGRAVGAFLDAPSADSLDHAREADGEPDAGVINQVATYPRITIAQAGAILGLKLSF